MRSPVQLTGKDTWRRTGWFSSLVSQSFDQLDFRQEIKWDKLSSLSDEECKAVSSTTRHHKSAEGYPDQFVLHSACQMRRCHLHEQQKLRDSCCYEDSGQWIRQQSASCFFQLLKKSNNVSPKVCSFEIRDPLFWRVHDVCTGRPCLPLKVHHKWQYGWPF